MNYNWSLEKLKIHKKYIQNCIRITEGLTKEEIHYLKKSIRQLKELENILVKNDYANRLHRIRYMDNDRLLPINTYQDYQSVPYYVNNAILKATRLLSDLNDSYDSIEIPALPVSNRELVEMSKKFYETLPDPTFFKEFQKYTDSKKHLLQFKKIDEENGCGGQIYFFFYPKYIPYFLIYREQNLNDFLSLNHEISHAIMYQHDTYMVDKNSHYFLTELEGHFFDFLSIQYLKQYYPKDVINQLEYDRITTVLEDFAIIFIDDTAIKLFKNNKKITLHAIKNRIEKWDIPFSLNHTLLKENLWEDVRFHSCHAFSFLTSLELETIYEKDPEYAFYLFQKVRNSKINNISQNLSENGIEFLKEGNDQSFQKKIHWINELGKIK